MVPLRPFQGVGLAALLRPSALSRGNLALLWYRPHARQGLHNRLLRSSVLSGLALLPRVCRIFIPSLPLSCPFFSYGSTLYHNPYVHADDTARSPRPLGLTNFAVLLGCTSADCWPLISKLYFKVYCLPLEHVVFLICSDMSSCLLSFPLRQAVSSAARHGLHLVCRLDIHGHRARQPMVPIHQRHCARGRLMGSLISILGWPLSNDSRGREKKRRAATFPPGLSYDIAVLKQGMVPAP